MATDPYAQHNHTHSDYEGRNEPVYNPYSYSSGPELGAYHAPGEAHFPSYRDEDEVPAASDRPGLDKPLPEPSRNTSYTTTPPREKSSTALRTFRKSEQGNLWTKGSRVRCFGRFFCCTVMTVVLLIVSIVLTMALWIRPPDVVFNGVSFEGGSANVSIANGGFSIPLILNISVNNPNYLSVTFKEISAAATYPSTSVSVGGGAIDNIKFPSSTTAYISFPFTITYTVSSDPNLAVLKDLATKCTASQDLTVNYLLTLKIRIVALLSPHFTSSASFQCPLSEADIQSIGGSLLGGSS